MGSPRIKGNTDLLLDEALRGAQSQGAEVERIIVDKLNIAPCREYYGCLKDGNCVIRDEMDDIYPKLLCQALWARKYVLKQNLPDSERKGAFIAVGATRGKQLFDGSILTVKYLFQSIGVNYVDELLVRGVDKKGEIKEHPTALSDAFELGIRLAQG